MSIDGGYVRDGEQKQRHFAVIADKSMLIFTHSEEHDRPSSKCFAFVQSNDTKPKRQLLEVLKSQGMQMDQQLTFLSDGEDTVRDLQLYLHSDAEHILDWFHVSVLLTVLDQ